MVNYSKYSSIGKVFYRGNELVGYKVDGSCFTPRDMLKVYQRFEYFIKTARYNQARQFEKRNNFPRTWLNRIVSAVIHDNRYNSLAKILIKEFQDRGFTENWLNPEKR